MSSVDRWGPDDYGKAARIARALLRAESRYRRRAAAYGRGRRATDLVDTHRLALLLVDADRLVRDLMRARP